ncbi:MAG: PadR family transcriptional regulator [Pseudomonadota bacterium]
MKRNPNKNLGEFEMLVLASIVRQDGDAYGVSIKSDIEARTGRSASLGALYATLGRLEDKLYVTSTMGEATAERGGRAKRYFKIEPLGLELLEQSLSAIRAMTEGLDTTRRPA